MMFISDIRAHCPRPKCPNRKRATKRQRGFTEPKMKVPSSRPFVLRRLFRRIFHPHTPLGVAGGVDGHCCLS
jgi:hypothetical protein